MKTDTVYLEHIRDAIARIRLYMDGVSREAFFRNPEKQDAVIRQLEIVGEASRHLQESLRIRYNMIPWRAIIGMRNRISHDYLNVDLSIVWDVVTTDLTNLEEQIQQILKERSS